MDTSNKHYAWLWDSHLGVNPQEITIRERISTHMATSNLAQRRSEQLIDSCNSVRRLPRLVPLFPVGNYTPRSLCGHYGQIKRGSIFCCMICHSSGQDDHPALQNYFSAEVGCKQNWRDGFPSVRSCGRISSETRKQRRQRLFGGIPNSTK